MLERILMGGGNDDGRAFVYRTNATEVRMWAKAVDSHNLEPDETVFMVHSGGHLVPLTPATSLNKGAVIDEYNAIMAAQMEARKKPKESPIKDVIEAIEADVQPPIPSTA